MEKEFCFVLGEGGDSGGFIFGKFFVFVIMELLMFILVRYMLYFSIKMSDFLSYVVIKIRLSEESVRLVVVIVIIFFDLLFFCLFVGIVLIIIWKCIIVY